VEPGYVTRDATEMKIYSLDLNEEIFKGTMENIYDALTPILPEAMHRYVKRFPHLTVDLYAEGRRGIVKAIRDYQAGIQPLETFPQWVSIMIRQCCYETIRNLQPVRVPNGSTLTFEFHDVGIIDQEVFTRDNIEIDDLVEEIAHHDEKLIQIIHFRLEGFSESEIGELLGVTQQAIHFKIIEIRKRAAKLGFTERKVKINQTKVCINCKVEKSLSDFYAGKNSCKVCLIQKQKKYNAPIGAEG
jgi:RNA polymerase sigma factor (sigma-70 family)